MTCFDFSPEAFAPRDRSPVCDGSEGDFEAALLREQYRSLARMAPYYCGVATVGTVMLGCFVRETSSPLTAIVLAGAFAFVLFRLVYWLRVRPRIERQSLDVIRRDLRQANIEIPTGTFVFALIAATTIRQSGLLEESLLLVASWIVAAACALCLMRLGRC